MIRSEKQSPASDPPHPEEALGGDTTSSDSSLVPEAQRVRQGAAWSGARSIVLRVAGQLTTIAVVRIVSPDEFGIWALAFTVHSIVGNLADLGVASLLIRRDTDKSTLAPSASFVGIGVGGLLALLIFGGAHQLASALGAVEAGPVIQVMSLSIFLTGVFAVPNSLLARDFRQKQLFFASIASLVVANSTLLLLAIAGAGPLAFAWSTVLGQVVAGLVTVRQAGWIWPRPQVDAVKVLLRFGAPLSIANVVNFTYLNVDYAIVSRLKGATALGVYLLAFNIASWPYAILGSSVNSVSMPAFSAADGLPELRRRIEAVTQAVALLAFPAAAMLTALAHPLVAVLYGEKWASAATALPLLAPYGAVFLLTLVLGNLLVASGKPGWLLILQVVWLTALFPVMFFSVAQYGPRGAGIAHLFTVLVVALPVYSWVVWRCTGARPTIVWHAIRAPMLLSFAAGTIAWSISSVADHAVVSLLVGGLIGSAFYGLAASPLLVTRLGPRLAGARRLDPVSCAVLLSATRLRLTWLYR